LKRVDLFLYLLFIDLLAMEASKKKPAANPAPAAKMPAPKLSSGKYTFSKAECLRRYISKKSKKCGKGISPAKKAEVRVFIATFV
jgi:hypothetical protein